MKQEAGVILHGSTQPSASKCLQTLLPSRLSTIHVSWGARLSTDAGKLCSYGVVTDAGAEL